MKIVVNHLTRMKPGYICVAGIDVESHDHVRPVLGGKRLAVDLLRRHGGPFEMAAIVDLGITKPAGSPPETEDHWFDPTRTAVVNDLDAKKFWKLLQSVSRKKLAEIFGADLVSRGKGCTLDQRAGIGSLGCLLPGSPPEFSVSWGKVRAKVSDGIFSADLSVTDLRLYEDDQQTPRMDVLQSVQRRIRDGVGVVLSVGLARAFQASGDSAARHWLQLNNVHLEDDPAWHVG